MSLRVMLIGQNRTEAAPLAQALMDAGYQLAARAALQAGVLREIESCKPDLIVVDADSPDHEMLETLRLISSNYPKPIVIFARHSDKVSVAEAIRAGASAYVVDGLSPARLRPIIEAACARFSEFQNLRSELAQTKDRLEERKQIDRAKGILMKHKALDEQQAYVLLRKMAMDKNIRIGAAARDVIAAAQLLDH